MSICIHPKFDIDGTKINARFENLDTELNIKLFVSEGDGKYPVYTGATTVTPTDSNQMLATNKKSLESDITVLKVPTYETSNPAGGYTFTILS